MAATVPGAICHGKMWNRAAPKRMHSEFSLLRMTRFVPGLVGAGMCFGDIDRAITNLRGSDDVRMNLIDPPVLPAHSEGIGWWSVAIGALSGVALAFLISLIGDTIGGGIGGSFAATRPDGIAGASMLYKNQKKRSGADANQPHSGKQGLKE